MKKMSKGEIKIEPVLSDSEDYQGQRKPPVAVVNPTKNQHKPRKHKVKKESTLLNGQNKVFILSFTESSDKLLGLEISYTVYLVNRPRIGPLFVIFPASL